MSVPGSVPGLEAPFRALPAHGEAGTVFLCTLCGCRFNHGGQVCGACPMAAGCELVKCPDCGFQFPRASSIADWVARIWTRWRRRP